MFAFFNILSEVVVFCFNMIGISLFESTRTKLQNNFISRVNCSCLLKLVIWLKVFFSFKEDQSFQNMSFYIVEAISYCLISVIDIPSFCSFHKVKTRKTTANAFKCVFIFVISILKRKSIEVRKIVTRIQLECLLNVIYGICVWL